MMIGPTRSLVEYPQPSLTSAERVRLLASHIAKINPIKAVAVTPKCSSIPLHVFLPVTHPDPDTTPRLQRTRLKIPLTPY